MPRSVRISLLIPLFLAAFSASAGTGPYQHVLLLSLDGLHNADINDPSVAPYIPDILDIAHHGITYSNAYAVKPTDNFPNMVAQVTGLKPAALLPAQAPSGPRAAPQSATPEKTPQPAPASR